MLWKADGALAIHPAPAGLAESESWATDGKTDRIGERVGDQLRQEDPMKQPTREDEQSFFKNCLKGGGGGAVSWDVWRSERGRTQVLAGHRIGVSGDRRRDLE